MNVESFGKLLQNPVLNRVKELLFPYFRPCISIQTKTCSDTEIPIGRSKIGGKPDLPENIQWPSIHNASPSAEDLEKLKGNLDPLLQKSFGILADELSKDGPKRSLSFLAQINLGEIKDIASDLELPKKGMLYFFIINDGELIDLDQTESPKKYTVLFSDSTKLIRKNYPKSILAENKIKPCLLTFKEGVSVDPFTLDDQIFDQGVINMVRENFSPLQVVNKIGGIPDSVQEDARSYCPIIGNSENFEDWKLLLQLSGMDELNMNFGDAGKIYFFIHRDLLKKNNFSEVFSITQYA